MSLGSGRRPDHKYVAKKYMEDVERIRLIRTTSVDVRESDLRTPQPNLDADVQ